MGQWAFSAILLLSIYAIVALGNGTKLDIYFLRDFRLILYLMTLIGLISLQYRNVVITGQAIKLFAILSGCSCILYSGLSAAGIFAFEDSFYVTNSFRYFAVSSYFCFGFIAFNSFLPPKHRQGVLYYLALMVSLTGVALTGLRVMTFIALILFLVGSLRSRRGRNALLVVLFVGVPILGLMEGSEGAGRAIMRLGEMSYETVIYQLQSRYSPFFVEYTKFDGIKIFLGGGFGQTYEIPWFFHRESKDSTNNFVDNTFLTLYGKFGGFAVFLLAAYIFSYSRILLPNSRRISGMAAVALVLLWLVYALPYQMTSIGLALALFAVGAMSQTKHLESRGNMEPQK